MKTLLIFIAILAATVAAAKPTKEDPEEKVMLMTWKAYLVLITLITLVFSVLGSILSTGGQRGSINMKNGFIAPAIGPWSHYLEPNGESFLYWEAGRQCFAIVLTIALFGAVYFAIKTQSKMLMILSLIPLVIWNLSGIVKVLIELA